MRCGRAPGVNGVSRAEAGVSGRPLSRDSLWRSGADSHILGKFDPNQMTVLLGSVAKSADPQRHPKAQEEGVQAGPRVALRLLETLRACGGMAGVRDAQASPRSLSCTPSQLLLFLFLAGKCRLC